MWIEIEKQFGTCIVNIKTVKTGPRIFFILFQINFALTTLQIRAIKWNKKVEINGKLHFQGFFLKYFQDFSLFSTF